MSKVGFRMSIPIVCKHSVGHDLEMLIPMTSGRFVIIGLVVDGFILIIPLSEGVDSTLMMRLRIRNLNLCEESVRWTSIGHKFGEAFEHGSQSRFCQCNEFVYGMSAFNEFLSPPREYLLFRRFYGKLKGFQM